MAERDDVRALLDALPRCDSCGEPATHRLIALHWCDACAPRQTTRLPWADAAARLVTPPAPAAPADPAGEVAGLAADLARERARADAAEARLAEEQDACRRLAQVVRDDAAEIDRRQVEVERLRTLLSELSLRCQELRDRENDYASEVASYTGNSCQNDPDVQAAWENRYHARRVLDELLERIKP